MFGLFQKHLQHIVVIVYSVSSQPVSLSDREVISRLRNCLLALAAHKVLLYDTSVLYCYESSIQHQVGYRLLHGTAVTNLLHKQQTTLYVYIQLQGLAIYTLCANNILC